MIRLLALLATAAGLLFAAASAQAAFPGRNGLLVIQPRHGSGLVLTDVHGHHVRAICTDSTLCGRPRTPRFAPDGLNIAFIDGRTGRPAIVGADGLCTWCLLGPAVTKLTGTAAAFTNSGQAFTLAGSKGLWQLSLTGANPQSLQGGMVADAVVSSRGTLAFVVRGSIWLLSSGRAARRLAYGTQPAFAPNGRRLAFVHGGWIWSVSTRGGRPLRLARGSSPEFSPDGHDLAFIGSAGRVYIAGARGRHPHLVPRVRGRSLDWQPIPRSSSLPCSVPAGQQVVAQTPEALITTNGSTWWGCLMAIGKRQPLAAQGLSQATIGLTQLAGRFAAVVERGSDRNGGCSTAVVRFDLASGAQVSSYGQNCSFAPNARGVDGLVLDSSGFLGWHAFEQAAGPQPLIAADCPTSSLCVTGDSLGKAATSTGPTGGAGRWALAKVAPSFGGPMACAGTALCVAASGGAIISSTNPTGGAGAWTTPVVIDPSNVIGRIACVSSSECVAVDSAGNVLTSTSPSTNTWSAPTHVASGVLTGVSCPASDLCVAVGANGVAVSSTDPFASTPTWTGTTADPGGFELDGVACPSRHRCVATDSNGNVLTEDPSGVGTWTVAPLPVNPGASSLAPTCASTTLCAIPYAAGVIVSTSPTVPSSWTATQLLTSPNDHLGALTCAPGSSLCLATDQEGNVLTTTHPTGGSAAWTATAVDVPPCGACMAEQVFAQDDRGRQALDTVQPGSGQVLGNLALSGNGTVLSWIRNTHPPQPESAQLH